MQIEREKPHSRTTTLLIELQGEGETVYKPILVNETANDAITHFIIEEKGRLKKRLEKLRTVPAKRSKRETRDIRKSREKTINKEQLEEKLSVLKGESFRPIRLVTKGEEIVELKLVSFAQEEQKRWWAYLKQEDQISKMAEVVQIYPDGIKLLLEVYNIRHRMKFGLPEEAKQAREELDSFNLKAREIPMEFDTLLVPLFRMITEKFGS
jgi:hypothetical protein